MWWIACLFILLSCGCLVAGNPGSAGPASRLGNGEEQAYLEKWKQLQKYVEPLKRMINKIDKDEGETLLDAEVRALFMYC